MEIFEPENQKQVKYFLKLMIVSMVNYIYIFNYLLINAKHL